jgi:DNA-binding GntR family transcriptional regulator
MNNGFRFITLGEEVASYLKNQILHGYYCSGERLYETQIAKELNISRSPIREAFKRLEYEGLIKVIQRKGVYVIDVDEREIIEIIQFRSILEEHVIETIIKEGLLTSKALSSLKGCLKKMKTVVEDESLEEVDKFSELNDIDMLFHSLLFELVGSRLLLQQFNNMMLRIKALLVLANSLYCDFQKIIDEHYQIIQSIQENNYIRAQKQLRKHLELTKKLLLIRDKTENRNISNSVSQKG